jgi:hypothetical protein
MLWRVVGMTTPRARSYVLLVVLFAVGCSTGASRSAPRASQLDAPVASSGGATIEGSPSAADRELAAALAGEWRLADRDAEARIDQAVSRVTDQMNFFVRGIANGRLDEALNPERRVVLEPDGDHVVVAIGQGRPYRLALNGPAISRNVDGNAVRTRATMRDGRLTVEETTDQGTRLLVFQARGRSLTVSTRIQADELPEDIAYRLTYQRAGGEGIASR